MSGLRRRPEIIWLVLAAVVLCLAVAWCALTVVTKYQQAITRLDDLEPRYARLLGIRQNSELFEREEDLLNSNLLEFVHSADKDSGQLANEALQQVREMAARHKLSITSSQTSAAVQQDAFDRIGINLSVEGSWPSLVGLLSDLGQQQPAIYYSLLQINGRDVANGVARLLTARLDLYVLQEHAP